MRAHLGNHRGLVILLLFSRRLRRSTCSLLSHTVLLLTLSILKVTRRHVECCQCCQQVWPNISGPFIIKIWANAQSGLDGYILSRKISFVAFCIYTSAVFLQKTAEEFKHETVLAVFPEKWNCAACHVIVRENLSMELKGENMKTENIAFMLTWSCIEHLVRTSLQYSLY